MLGLVVWLDWVGLVCLGVWGWLVGFGWARRVGWVGIGSGGWGWLGLEELGWVWMEWDGFGWSGMGLDGVG